LELAKKDFLFHHHYGIGELGKDITLYDQDEMADELHRLESNQTSLAISLMKGIGPDHTVVDAGSGRGGTAFMLHLLLKCKVIGVNTSGYQIDFSKNLASKMKMDNYVCFIFNNMERIDLDDESVDAIITNETTMYIKRLKSLYVEFGRILKKGGIYVNATWCKNDLHEGDFIACQRIEEHYMVRMHFRSEYIKALVNNGFTPFSIWDLTENAVPYWYLRSRYIHRTGIEGSFLEAYEKKEMNYMMIGAYKLKS